MNTSPIIKMLFAEEHISVSSLGQYLRCPRKYRLRYIDRAPPKSKSVALSFGSILHETLAVFYSALKEKQTEPTADELVDIFADAWHRELKSSNVPILFGDKESADSMTDTGAAMIRVFHAKAERPPRAAKFIAVAIVPGPARMGIARGEMATPSSASLRF
jgi:hypothetical protein